jgi:HPr Serine kinase C-terminal domain
LTERYYYRHHGISLSSNQPLPRLTPLVPRVPDVSIDVVEPGQLPGTGWPWVMPAPKLPLWRARTGDGSLLRLRYARDDEWAEFVIDEHGREIRAGRSENVLLREAAELLLGQVFSCALAQRQLTCLHAAVVELRGRVLALVGAAGAGKSTTALALVQRGATLVSDDRAVLRERNGRFMVSVGLPRMRIRPDTARALVGSFAKLEPMWVHEQRRPAKRYLHTPTAANGDAVDERSLDLIFLLGSLGRADDKPQFRRLRPAEALPPLMANRHMVEVLERDAHVRDFGRLARLAERVHVLELTRPEELSSIHPTAAAIEAAVVSIG